MEGLNHVLFHIAFLLLFLAMGIVVGKKSMRPQIKLLEGLLKESVSLMNKCSDELCRVISKNKRIKQ